MVTATAKRPTLGPISREEVYPLQLFSQLTGLNRYAIRQARRNGLKVKKIGIRNFVSGADWHAYVDSVHG